ncbi:MAG: hypothetical protein GXP59_08895 [Deltaproteobacteria bacterium]|nr:hypothetical protein [Deltaproteobacteria bacterium]
MKTKFIPLLAFLLPLLAVGYAGWLAVSRAPAPVSARDIFACQHHKNDFVVPDTAEVKKVNDITRKLTLITYPPAAESRDLDLKIFGQEVAAQGQSGGRRPRPAAKTAYDITFTFVSATDRYCYINGVFYRQGDVMADGGRISKIMLAEVLIIKNNISQWVPVQRPNINSGNIKPGK